METTLGYVLMISLAVLLEYSEGKLFKIQADYQRNRENHPVWDLTNSSDGNAVILEPHKTLSINFCLRTNSHVAVTDFRFSNGNGSEVVILEIDEIVMGMFRSPANKEHSWNLFLSTGRFPRAPVLPIGWHKLMVSLQHQEDQLIRRYKQRLKEQ